MKSSPILALAVLCSSSIAYAQAQPGAEPSEEELTETPPPTPAPAPVPPPAAEAPTKTAAPTPSWYTPPSQPAPAQAQPVDEAPEEPLPPALPPGWMGSIGIRTAYVSHTGFDPFAENDALVQGSIALSRRVWMQGSFSVAGALELDFGARNATARGETTKLDTWRATVGPELRWNLIPQLFFYARPAVGVSRSVASLEEGTSRTTLYAKSWDLAVDGAAGAAFAFWDLRNRTSDLRFWLVGEGGYAWTQASELQLSPEEESGAPERTEPLDLGDLALRGPYFKLAIAASF